MVDWYPTLLKLAGAAPEQEHALDGRDAWATIARRAPSPHDAILLNTTPAGGALRMGAWKLVVAGDVDANDLDAVAAAGEGARGKGKKAKKAVAAGVELFDLASDPGEKTNLASQNPDKVRELRARLDAFAREAVPPKAEGKPEDFKAPRVWGQPD
jgi:arylsulfatase A-like enzyme